jgi:hypothetical protein
MRYSNIYSSYSRSTPEDEGDTDFSPTGYDRYRRNPGKGGPMEGQPEPIYNTKPPPQTPAPAEAPPEAVMSGGVSPSPMSGPAGVGGNGGFGFTNLAQYLYANPMGTGPGSGYAPTPTGYGAGDYNADMHGFAPNGAYTLGMSSVDNALNQTYGRNAGTPAAPAASAPTPTGAPSGGFTPATEDPNDTDNRRRGGGYRQMRSLMGAIQ